MKITRLALLPGSSGVKLTVTGLYGEAPLVLESSTSPGYWNSVSTNFPSGGTPSEATITTSDGVTTTPRFYRFRQPLP
jgi:hypothetical protein